MAPGEDELRLFLMYGIRTAPPHCVSRRPNGLGGEALLLSSRSLSNSFFIFLRLIFVFSLLPPLLIFGKGVEFCLVLLFNSLTLNNFR